jgi:hypothetical protein
MARASDARVLLHHTLISTPHPYGHRSRFFNQFSVIAVAWIALYVCRAHFGMVRIVPCRIHFIREITRISSVNNLAYILLISDLE